MLTPDSCHPHVFSSIIFGQPYQFSTHSSAYHDFITAKRVVQKHQCEHGYFRSFIRSCFRCVLELTGQTHLMTGKLGSMRAIVEFVNAVYSFYVHSVHAGPNSIPIVNRVLCFNRNIVHLIVFVSVIQ